MRVALVRHRRRALVAGRERFLGFANLGPLQMADLDRHLFERRPDPGEHREEEGVAVALHDLGRGGSGAQAERRADLVFEIGRNMGVRADRSGDLADRHVLAGKVEAALVAAQFVVPDGELEAERRRFGVDAVGAADHDRVFVLDRLLADDLDQTSRVRDRAAVRPRSSGSRGRCRPHRSWSGRDG